MKPGKRNWQGKLVSFCAMALVLSFVTASLGQTDVTGGGAVDKGKTPKKISKTQDRLLEFFTFAAGTPMPAKPGRVASVTRKGKPKAGYPTYAVTKAFKDHPGLPTTISYLGSEDLQPLLPVTEQGAKFHK